MDGGEVSLCESRRQAVANVDVYNLVCGIGDDLLVDSFGLSSS